MNFFLKGFHDNVNSLFTSPYTGKDLFVVVRVVVSVGLSAGLEIARHQTHTSSCFLGFLCKILASVTATMYHK